VAAGAAAHVHGAGAGDDLQGLHHLLAAVQQPAAEVVVGPRLLPVERLQPFAVAVALAAGKCEVVDDAQVRNEAHGSIADCELRIADSKSRGIGPSSVMTPGGRYGSRLPRWRPVHWLPRASHSACLPPPIPTR